MTDRALPPKKELRQQVRDAGARRHGLTLRTIAA